MLRRVVAAWLILALSLPSPALALRPTNAGQEESIQQALAAGLEQRPGFLSSMAVATVRLFAFGAAAWFGIQAVSTSAQPALPPTSPAPARATRTVDMAPLTELHWQRWLRRPAVWSLADERFINETFAPFFQEWTAAHQAWERFSKLPYNPSDVRMHSQEAREQHQRLFDLAKTWLVAQGVAVPETYSPENFNTVLMFTLVDFLASKGVVCMTWESVWVDAAGTPLWSFWPHEVSRVTRVGPANDEIDIEPWGQNIAPPHSRISARVEAGTIYLDPAAMQVRLTLRNALGKDEIEFFRQRSTLSFWALMDENPEWVGQIATNRRAALEFSARRLNAQDPWVVTESGPVRVDESEEMRQQLSGHEKLHRTDGQSSDAALIDMSRAIAVETATPRYSNAYRHAERRAHRPELRVAPRGFLSMMVAQMISLEVFQPRNPTEAAAMVGWDQDLQALVEIIRRNPSAYGVELRPQSRIPIDYQILAQLDRPAHSQHPERGARLALAFERSLGMAPPWWRTTPAYVSYTALVAALTLGIYYGPRALRRFRGGRRVRANALASHQVNAATREALEAHLQRLNHPDLRAVSIAQRTQIAAAVIEDRADHGAFPNAERFIARMLNRHLHRINRPALKAIAETLDFAQGGLEGNWVDDPEVKAILTRYPDPVARPDMRFGTTAPETNQDHARRVVQIAQLLAAEAGLDPRQGRLLRIAAALHDAGALQKTTLVEQQRLLQHAATVIQRNGVPVPIRQRDLADHYALGWDRRMDIAARATHDLDPSGQDPAMAKALEDILLDGEKTLEILDALVEAQQLQFADPRDLQVIQAMIRAADWIGLLTTQPAYTSTLPTEVVEQAIALSAWLELADTMEASANLARGEGFYRNRPRDLANVMQSLLRRQHEQAVSEGALATALWLFDADHPSHRALMRILADSRKIGQAGQRWADRDQRIMLAIHVAAQRHDSPTALIATVASAAAGGLEETPAAFVDAALSAWRQPPIPSPELIRPGAGETYHPGTRMCDAQAVGSIRHLMANLISHAPVETLTRTRAETMIDELLARDTVVPGRPMDTISDNELVEMGLAVLRGVFGPVDPMAELKQSWNDQAMTVLPAMQAMVEESADPDEQWRRAISLGIIGNAIDFAAAESRANMERGWELTAEIARARTLTYRLDARQPWLEAKPPAGSHVLLLADNAGEFVCDLPLIKLWLDRGCRVTVAGKSLPHFNDMTVEDLRAFFARPDVMRFLGAARVQRQIAIIASGTMMTGFDLRRATPELLAAWKSADVIYAKGQGMIETMRYRPLTRQVLHAVQVKQPQYFHERVPVEFGDALFLVTPAAAGGLEERGRDVTARQAVILVGPAASAAQILGEWVEVRTAGGLEEARAIAGQLARRGLTATIVTADHFSPALDPILAAAGLEPSARDRLLTTLREQTYQSQA